MDPRRRCYVCLAPTAAVSPCACKLPLHRQCLRALLQRPGLHDRCSVCLTPLRPPGMDVRRALAFMGRALVHVAMVLVCTGSGTVGTWTVLGTTFAVVVATDVAVRRWYDLPRRRGNEGPG